ncbi:MAG: DegT/DnrJ/EryC1/StrS family aminotransferase [Methanomicrobiaceae archaeon]|nr:DegT/DnrJ/EryC1/StrS family aminotransferase [Methanomicrobiaceae archaeon]
MNKINMAEMFCDDEIKNAVLSVLTSGNYIKGENNIGFEAEFSGFCSVRHTIAVNSGTNALILALKCLGIKPGDEVLVPSHTFIATANSVIFCGAKPVFADINSDNYTIDVSDIKSKITPRTKAVIPVHIYGHPCDMNPVKEIAEEKDLYIIEDACQAHGAKYYGKTAGSLGDVAAFSFFPSKNMTVAGDGGAVTTNNDEIADLACAIRDQGRKDGEKYHHDYPGLNLRLSEIHAAIGRIQLKHLSDWNLKRRENAHYYSGFFSDCENVITPAETEWAEAVYHQYVIRVKNREKLRNYLSERGVSTGIHYPLPVHLQPAMKDYSDPVSLPVTESFADEILSIPVHPFLKREEREFIAKSIQEFYNGIK